MTTPQTRTFLSLGPAGLSLEFEGEDTPEPLTTHENPLTPDLDTAKPSTESTGAWIIHHPSRGGPSSGLREVMMTLATYGRIGAAEVREMGASLRRMPTLSVRARHKRPGQWTDRTRARRAERLRRAAARREREWSRRDLARRWW